MLPFCGLAHNLEFPMFSFSASPLCRLLKKSHPTTNKIIKTPRTITLSSLPKGRGQICVIDPYNLALRQTCLNIGGVPSLISPHQNLTHQKEHRQVQQQLLPHRRQHHLNTRFCLRASIKSSSHTRTFTSTATKSHNMSASLIPSNPADLMVIRNVTPNIVTFSVPFSRFGRIKIGGRGTLGMFHIRSVTHS